MDALLPPELARRFTVRYMPGTNDFLVTDRERTRGMPVVAPNAAAVVRYVQGNLSDERVAQGLPSLFEAPPADPLAA